jgi:hypothetical protein
MTPDDMFSLASMAALPGWAILILAPRRWPLLNAVPALLIPLGLAGLYTGLVLTYFSASGGGFGSIAQVRHLFQSDPALVAGWVHYLAFDLMIGAVMAGRLDRIGVSRLLQAPILISIFMFGPVGLLLTLLTEASLRLPLPVLQRI